jgi:hypothetical protein
MSNIENNADTRPGWNEFPFDAQTVLLNIPAGSRTSSLHVSISPSPPTGSVIIHGRLANGETGSVRLSGRIYAAKLPFSDGRLGIQYLGETKSVQLNLESYVLAHPANWSR